MTKNGSGKKHNTNLAFQTQILMFHNVNAYFEVQCVDNCFDMFRVHSKTTIALDGIG